MKSPIILQPIYQTRVWGGRNLGTVYGRDLPGDESLLIGESWDVVDRPEAQSVVIGGQYVGRTLGELWRDQRDEVFGSDAPDRERFPILGKILDVRQTLSVQVHPPPGIAEKLGGESKSEFWVASKVEKGALWYAGLKTGIGRETFEKSMRAGTTAECLHQLPVGEGDGLYVPSGTVHALGAGQMVFEIQENSDTTFRVYDWGRVAAGGVGRELHNEEAMQSINFVATECVPVTKNDGCLFAGSEFRVERMVLPPRARRVLSPGFSVVALVSGAVTCGGQSFGAGDYFLLPANEAGGMVVESSVQAAEEGSSLLRVTWP